VVYPNPANSRIVVQLPTLMDQGVISVFDVLGNQVIATTKFVGSKTEVDLSELTSGIYFIKTENKNFRLCNQVVKI
jgi:Secretion system C-terminal sorting domain